MMATALGFDAAECPDPVPQEINGMRVAWCEVYIGGSSAFRTWTDAEIARVAHLPKLPVWVPTPGSDNPRQAAGACLTALRAHGVPAFASPYRAVMVDLETGIEPDPGWLGLFRDRILAGGYDTMPYGSTAWIFGYPKYTGYIVADYTGKPVLYPHPGVAGTQYAAEVPVPGGTVDLDVLDTLFLPHLGEWK
jgi:hypothetical protein